MFMSNYIICPKCGRPISAVISTKEPCYLCECGYDSRNIKIITSSESTVGSASLYNQNELSDRESGINGQRDNY